MKTPTPLFCLLLFICITTVISAQTIDDLKTIAVLHIETEGIITPPSEMGDTTRTEMGRVCQYYLMDKYDTDYLVRKNNLNITNCYDTNCLVDIGHILQVDKMLSGGVELNEGRLVITLRLIDVETAQIEKTHSMTFQNQLNQIQPKIGVTLRKMLELEKTESILTQRTKERVDENSVHSSEEDRLSLNESPNLNY